MVVSTVDFSGGGAQSASASTNSAGIWMGIGGDAGSLIFDVEMVVTGDAVIGGGRPAVFNIENLNQFEDNIQSFVGNAYLNDLQNQLPGQIRLAALSSGITPIDDIQGIINNDIQPMQNFEISNGQPTNVPPVVSFIEGISTQSVADVNLRPSLQDIAQRGGFGTGIFITYRIRWEYPTINIPKFNGTQVFENLPDVNDLIDRIQSLNLQHGLPSGGIFGGLNEVLVQVNLSPQLFIETTDITLDCEILTRALNIDDQPIRARFREIAEQASSALGGATSTEENLQQIHNEIENRGFSLPEPGEQFTGIERDEINIGGIREVIGQNISNDQFRDWEELFRQDDPQDLGIPGESSISDVQENLDDLRDRITSIGCGNLSIDGTNIDDIRSDLEDARVAQRIAEDLKIILEPIFNQIQVGPDCIGNYSDIDQQISSLRDGFEQFSPQNIQSFISNFSEFRGQSSEQIRTELQSRRSELLSTITQQVEEPQCIDQFERRVEDIPSLPSIDGTDVPETPDVLDCASTDVTPQSLQSDINDFVSNAREFSRLREIERNQDRFDEITSQGQSLRERVNDEVDQRQCINQWQDRVQSALSRARQAGPRRAAVVPCGQRHPDIEEQVGQFEDQVLGLTAPVTPDTIQQVSQQGSDIIEDIQANIDSGQCRQDFISRIRGATGRLQGLQEQVRITVVEDQGEQAQESLNQLISLIQDVEVRRSGIGGNGDRDNIL